MKSLGLILILLAAIGASANEGSGVPSLSHLDKSAFRSRVIRSSLFSEVQGNDQAVNLVDNLKYSSLEEMGAAGLTSAALTEQPWSSSYWPIYLGVLSNRYADKTFPASQDWKANNDYLQKNFGQGSVDSLSPAEKYDLLVGDSAFTLSHHMLTDGQRYFDEKGSVESWMGICHGWAPASFMLPRPKHWITVIAADGHTKIPFYPADIKGLASLLWANADTPTRSIGGRCNEAAPENDSLGRPKEQDCLDTNPGTWHLAVVNQIGVAKRSFVIDAEETSEVWNQPIYSYAYEYFNPKTKQSVTTLQDARVQIADFAEDRLHAVRSPQTASVVGISMNVVYTSETWPSQAKVDDRDLDATRTLNLQYDLELDETGKIIGGEWYENDHPDFLWSPVKGATAQSVGDEALDRAGNHLTWNSKMAPPRSWKSAAARSSAYGQPMARIVESLIRFSRVEN